MESLFAGILFNGNIHELVHTRNIQVYNCQEYACVVQISMNSCHPPQMGDPAGATVGLTPSFQILFIHC